MNAAIKHICSYASIIFCLIALSTFCLRKTDGFSILSILSHMPSNIKWDNPSLTKCETDVLQEALSQDYSYLGRGGQCFAFISHDKRFVIKFFRTHFRPFSALITQHFPWISKQKRKKKLDRALFKLFRDFNSYLYASTDLKEETGVIFVHLNKTQDLKKQLSITDTLNIAHQIDLDQFEFVVQKRAVLAFEYLSGLLKNHEYEKTKEAMHALIKLALTCCNKGYHHEDARIADNFGFIDDRPYIIDIGRFAKDGSRPSRQTLQKDYTIMMDQLREWITKSYPSHANLLEEDLDALYPIR